jgi:hypothetical protein
MSLSQILGIICVVLAGLLMGALVWPMKLMKKFQFEHWWFISMVTGLVIIPWTVTFLGCPHALSAYARVPVRTLLTANLWATGWGIANVLCGLCFIRIGVALTGAILTGIGVSLGVTLPMVVKGSGLFHAAPDPASPAGLAVLAGVSLMIVGVIFAARAGVGRDRALQANRRESGSFAGGLLMAVLAGVLSCGMGLAFVYSQGPIVDAMKSNGAGEIPATFAVWAVSLIGGAVVNLGYPLVLMARRKSFHILTQSWSEILLAAIIGLNLAGSIAFMGSGMRGLGALGASVGFGIQQAAQVLGGQALGFVSGEWRGVAGPARLQMYAAIAIIIFAALVMAFGSSLSSGS